MKLVFEIIALALCAIIILTKGKKRANLYLLSAFFMPTIFGTAHVIFSISVLISLWINNELQGQIRSFPFKNISITILCVYFLISIFDNRLSFIETVSRPIIYFVQTYLYLFIGYTLFNDEKMWLSISKTLLIILTLFAVYGFLTWAMQANPWYNFVSGVFEGTEDGMWSNVQDRGYRVCSFLYNPIAYGMVMGIGALSIWQLYLKTKNKKILLLLVLIVINVFLANSRTSIVAFGIAVIMYILFYNGISINAMAKFWGIGIVIILLYFNISTLNEMIDSVIDLFISGGNNTYGSNIELKNRQLAASLLYFKESPLFGHGLQYFRENIQTRSGGVSDLAGLEGYGYRMLVEMGLSMILVFVIFIFQFIKFALNNRKSSLQMSSIILSQFLAFIFFIIATGDYGNVFEFCLIIIGINLKYIIIERNKYKTNYGNKRFSAFNKELRG